MDVRGSHFYLTMYWAQALAAQTVDLEFANQFKALADSLTENESKIVEELNKVQGKPISVGGYYHSNEGDTEIAMRPSATLNDIINKFN